MKKIPLTQGKIAIVDDEDYKWLSKYKWHYHKGYAARTCRKTGRKRTIYMHREIMRTPEGFVTDHINGNKLDNRRVNLRICTKAQNNMNMKKFRSRKKAKHASRYKGVYWRGGRTPKWSAEIRYKGKQIHLGYFETEEEAAKAYDKAAIRLFGSFASPNFVSKGEMQCLKNSSKLYFQTKNGKTLETIIT